jgi:hypothetical protein
MKINNSLLIIFALVIILIVCIIYLIFKGNRKNKWFSVFYENYENYNSPFINPYKDYTISELITIILKIYSEYKYVIDKLNELKTNNKIDSSTYETMTVKLNNIITSIYSNISLIITKNSQKFQNILNGFYDPDVTNSPPSLPSIQMSTTTPTTPNPSPPTPSPSSMPTALNSSPTTPVVQSPPVNSTEQTPPPSITPNLNNDFNKKTYYIKEILIPILQNINNELHNLHTIKKDIDKIIK